MSRELKERLLITLALLAAARLLSHVPLPGIDPGAFFAFDPRVTARGTIGALGLLPYISASIIVILTLYFRRFRHGIDDRQVPVEFYTFSLAGVIVLMQSYGLAVFLESLVGPTGEVAVANPGWSFRFTTIVSQAAGTFLLIWLAYLISRKGLGNGVCLIIASRLCETLPQAFLDLWPRTSEINEDTFMQTVFLMLPLAAISLVAALVLIGARWQIPLQRSGKKVAPLRLRINGVGVIALTITQTLLYIPVTLSTILPPDSLAQTILKSFGERGVIHWLLWGILVFTATYFWTAWAYRPKGLQDSLSRFDYSAGASDSAPMDGLFERRLALVTFPWALGLPLLAGILFWLATESSLSLVAASMLFPMAAISLDLYRQFKAHRQMTAALIDADTDGMVCEACHASVSEIDKFCPSCGIAFEEGHPCDNHDEITASAHCVVCQKNLCQACSIVTRHRNTCQEHIEIEMIDGWATALTATTRLDAKLHLRELQDLDIPALMLSNTIEPLYGTLGLFEINPVTPFVVNRELGGGRIRVMVPACDWMKAQEHLSQKNYSAK